MSRHLPLFQERDVRRAIRAAAAEGLSVGAVEIRPDGTIMVRIGEPMDCSSESGDPTLDALLKAAGTQTHGAHRETD